MVPRLPIPNRTVKRLSADDSVVLPCESRSLPNTLSENPRLFGGFCFVRQRWSLGRDKPGADGFPAVLVGMVLKQTYIHFKMMKNSICLVGYVYLSVWRTYPSGSSVSYGGAVLFYCSHTLEETL